MGDIPARSKVLDLNFLPPNSPNQPDKSPKEPRKWASDWTKNIDVSFGLSPNPLVLKVRESVPQSSDATTGSCLDGNACRNKHLAFYDIANAEKTAGSLDTYIKENGLLAFARATENSHPAVQSVYGSIEEYARDLRATVETLHAKEIDKQHMKLWESFCQLWFGTRLFLGLIRGSAAIVSSKTLGMQPFYGEGYPPQGEVPVPGHVVETVGCLLESILQLHQESFLQELQKAVNQPAGTGYFFTLFLIVFVLLYEVEDSSKNCKRPSRFSSPEYKEILHESARVVVDIWTAYAQKAGVDFSNKEGLNASLDFLENTQRQLVVESYVAIAETSSVRASLGTTCFVLHMFDR